ncbi:hypothetical protein [Microbacterium sp. MM2322]|uniref:hypothetical protein n=1 Tax=Microbacterium sp. MM2322 TaxID=3157631 RepID=UPI0032D588D3
MTDPTTEPDASTPAVKWDPASDVDGYAWEDVRSRDPYLDFMLDRYFDVADQARGALGLTLMVGGAVVSGIAISRAEWIERTLTDFQPSNSAVVEEYLRPIWSHLHDHTVEESNRRDEADLPTRARRFIHLREVRILNGATMNVSTWRGDLASVDAWSLGSWNPPGVLTTDGDSDS